MITKLHHWWQEKRSSFWFIPAVMILDAVVLAAVLITVDANVDLGVVEGAPLVSVVVPGGLDDETVAELNAVYITSRQRVVDQDAAYGIRQIVDIAMRALSPGINDTTTAVICVDYLGAILVRLANRRIATSHRLDQGELRVIARGPSFESLLAEAFDQIRQNAAGNVGIMLRMLGELQTIASLTANPSRRRAVRERVQWIADLAERTIESTCDWARFESLVTSVREALIDENRFKSTC